MAAPALTPAPTPGWAEGWRLFLALALGLLALAALLLWPGPTVDSLRALVRWTARSSLLLFALAFGAAALDRLAPGAATRWLRRHRRPLGLGFAFSHLVHAVALVALARLDPVLFWQLTNPANLVTGGIAYGFILLMAATSSGAAQRWMGHWWRRLHLVGGWYIWLSFLITFGKRAPADPRYWGFVALVLLLAVLRLAVLRPRVPAGPIPAKQGA